MSSALSPDTVLEAVDILAPAGTPLTTTEVADEFDCTARTIYNKLEILVNEGPLETKKVGARGRVWWRPPDQSGGDSPDAAHAWPASTHTRLRERQDSFDTTMELPDREHLYNVIFNQTFQFIGLLETDGTLIDANEAALSFGGLTRDDVVGKPFWEADWWQISEQTQAQLQDAIDLAADGEFVRYEVEVQGNDHTAVIDFSLRPVTNETGEVTLLVPEGRDVTELVENERQLERLDQLNTVIRTIVRTVARAETREEIAETVCETLLEFEAYQAAVMGELSLPSDDFEPWAMTDGMRIYLEGVLDTEAPPLSEGPAARAVRTGELHVQDDLADLPYDYWQHLASTHGIQSYASIPLVFQETVYGVVGVYADRSEAFEQEKQQILTELGEIIGYALYALERKEVLEPTVELEFETAQIAEAFRAETDADFQVTVDSIVPLPNGTQQQFLTFTGLQPEIIRSVIAKSFPAFSDIQLLKKVGEKACVRVTADEEATAGIFDGYDGQHYSTTMQDETATVVGRFPVTVDTTALTRALGDRYPDIELVAKRRLLSPSQLRHLVDEELTDRQRTALRLAYFGGYYEQPRLSTGDELAADIGISRQTFHHHLRKAEDTVFYHLFEDATAVSF